MVSYEQFIKKFPTTEDFEKAYPVGKKVYWCDRYKYTIVGYVTDTQFSKKDDFSHLVVMKSWSKYKQRWFYQTADVYVFYATVEMVERELKEDKKREKKAKKLAENS